MSLRAIFALFFALSASAAGAEAARVVLPSGQSVSLMQVLVDEDQATVRFRFLAPEIGPAEPARTYDDVADDLPWLCDNLAVPVLDAVGLEVSGIVISLADRFIEFGNSDPSVTQFFEPFSLSEGACLVEQF